MDARRPEPDPLLTRVVADEAEQQRGNLKAFLGAAPRRVSHHLPILTFLRY